MRSVSVKTPVFRYPLHFRGLLAALAGVLFVHALRAGEATPTAEKIAHGSVVVAVVNGKPITFADVWKRVGRKLEHARTVLPEPQFQLYAKRQLLLMLEDLIDRELLLAKANEAGIKVSKRQIERFAEQEMAYFNQQGENLTSLEDYFRAIEEETGLTEKEYREELKARVAISQYLRKYVWQPEYFSPAVVRRYWEEHREEFRVGGYVEIRHVYVQRELPDYEKVVKYIEKAVAEGKFDQVAREAVEKGWSHRRGRDGAGLYRYRVDSEACEEGTEDVDGSLNSLWEPLAKAIRSLRIGQASPPIRSAVGTHFVKVVGRGGGRVRSFAEVQQQIQRKLSWELEDKVKRAYVKALVRKASIRRFPFPEETPVGHIDWRRDGKSAPATDSD